ncbi:sensor histidine kinase [Portibacter marinus]|uniref:sensor histidine kinase n=1 Tax=Portibacter marinus TaxID=2898660 RepID=UPI001F3CE366|nr:histidine kinase [Portibacter marinus]
MYTSNLKWTKQEKLRTNKEKSLLNTNVKSDSYRNSPTNANLKGGLNDIGFRLVLIPFFGIAIPWITNMVDTLDVGSWNFKLSFLYTIGIAYIVWEGNRFLLFTLRNYFDWFNKPLQKIGALLLVVPFYTVPISVLLLSFWYRLFANVAPEWSKIWLATAIILICVVFIVHVYETVFLVKEAESEKLANARLEVARAEAELQGLKTQIDPHFIFNSLNTLSYFIDINSKKAKIFNQKLSDVYRYILQNRDRDLVLLVEELQFAQDYFAMLKVRYDDAMYLNHDLLEIDQYLVLPNCLQLLIENAVKHNEFSDQKPLKVNINLEKGYIIVKNNMSVKRSHSDYGIGLSNLDERSRLLFKRPLSILVENGYFIVKVPVKKV